MAQWLRRPTVETLVFTGSSPAFAKNYFLRILEQMLTQCIGLITSANRLHVGIYYVQYICGGSH